MTINSKLAWKKQWKPRNTNLKKQKALSARAVPAGDWTLPRCFCNTNHCVFKECNRLEVSQHQEQDWILLHQRGGKVSFAAASRAGFWLPFLWGALPHPRRPFLSNSTSSKTILGTQANYRRRKWKCEQELPLAHCQLGKQQALQPPSHKDAFPHTPVFSLHTAHKNLVGQTLQSADVSVSAGSGPMWLRPQLQKALKCILNLSSFSSACADTRCLTGNKCLNYVQFSGI